MVEGAKFSITFSIESKLDQVRLVRAALSGVLAHLQIEESDIYALGLALTELVNNGFEHGYKGAEDRHIDINIQVCDADVEITLTDTAPPFPEDQRYRLLDAPIALEEPDEDWSMRGHGLQIVRQVVDSIKLTAETGGNRITVRKHVGLQVQ